jgi:hypothetical protein
MAKNLLIYRAGAAAVLFIAAAALGCQSEDRVKTYPVSAKVMSKGKPYKGGMLQFIPDDPTLTRDMRPTAYVMDDGSIKASTYFFNDGLPAGNYKVLVYKIHPVTGVNLAPERYSDAATTPFTATVQLPEKGAASPETDIGTFEIEK